MQAGLAISAGYLLGRTRKLKLALTVGGVVAGRRLGGSGNLLKQGLATLQSTPQAQRLKGEVRQQLFDAGKSAALTAAGGTMGRLASRVSPSVSVPSPADDREGDRGDDREDRPRKSPPRKGAARKATARKSPPQKSAPQKSAPRKSEPARKSAPRKSEPRKSSGRSAQRTRGGRNG
jgi:hypothetical protein